MADGSDPWDLSDEPSMEDFEAAEDEQPPVGARVALVRTLKTVGVLLVIVALLLYFVVPFNNALSDVLRRVRIPSIRLHTIPLAPEPTTIPTLPV